ncbi:hypothetical protein [Streptomyces hydrogenans]|uniref:hypothetical protein n=1 Tax=Streptomyces hydrogenans TaxID=1873719 RepID=UPI0034018ADE
MVDRFLADGRLTTNDFKDAILAEASRVTLTPASCRNWRQPMRELTRIKVELEQMTPSIVRPW